MRFTKLLSAIWKETSGFLLIAAVLSAVYVWLYRPTRFKSPMPTTNAPAAAISTATPPAKVTGFTVSPHTNTQNPTNISK